MDDLKREYYAAQHTVSFARMPLLFLGAFLSALGLAWALQFAFFHDWYLVILVPILAGLALAAALYLLVTWTHCRNRWLACGVGISAGLIAFLGYYYLCLIQILPPGNATRFDLLPRYILLRLQHDVVDDDVGRAQPPNVQKEPSIGLNAFAFLGELALIAGFPAIVAWRRARRAYCEELKQWMRQAVALFPMHSGESLEDAFQGGRVAEFIAKVPPGGDPQSACRLVLEYAKPATGSPLEYPFYASIEDIPADRPWYWPRRMRRTYVRQARLTPQEIVTVLPLFAGLARLLELEHPELRDLPTDVISAPDELSPATGMATISRVPEPFYQKVRTPGYTIKINLLGAIPLAFILGGGGLLALGGYLAYHEQIGLAVTPLLVGAVGAAWGIYTGGYCLGLYENRWIERRLRAEIARRPEFLVDPAAADATYVSIIPRESFAQVKMTLSSDLLLMRIDDKRKEILLEGDCDRYRIPSGAVAACQPLCFFHPIDVQHHNELWMVRLLIQVEGGMREILLSRGEKGWGPRTNNRRQQTAVQTAGAINALRIVPLTAKG
jgi:hypothetical protein